LTPEGRPEGAPEMSFLKHKDAYQFAGGIYWIVYRSFKHLNRSRREFQNLSICDLALQLTAIFCQVPLFTILTLVRSHLTALSQHYLPPCSVSVPSRLVGILVTIAYLLGPFVFISPLWLLAARIPFWRWLGKIGAAI
jgi:hypothetical protein